MFASIETLVVLIGGALLAIIALLGRLLIRERDAKRDAERQVDEQKERRQAEQESRELADEERRKTDAARRQTQKEADDGKTDHFESDR